MQIYVLKNGRQFGPFEKAKILEMTGSGELAPNDAAIRQDATHWSGLGSRECEK